MLLTFETKVPLMRSVASVVWHLLLPSINNFNKIEADIFSIGPMLLGDFPIFYQIVLIKPSTFICIAYISVYTDKICPKCVANKVIIKDIYCI